jgi:hypothetical protein
MTDQTRWGIDLVHTKNKAIKRQKDIINRALSEVEKLEEQYIVELMTEIEAIYERKYGDNKADKIRLKVVHFLVHFLFLVHFIMYQSKCGSRARMYIFIF